VLLLNEIGFDPGVDHMSAMGLIDRARRKGGKIVEYRSYCGGIPAPESNDNPLGYKLTWSPAGVITAAKAQAVFRLGGETIDLHGDELHRNTSRIEIDGVGELEAYPNRDSLQYVPLYRLDHAKTILRATLRYPGWCDTVHRLANLGLFDEMEMNMEGLTWGDLIDRLVGCDEEERRESVAEELGLDEHGGPMGRLEWLGLFGDTPVGLRRASPLAALLALFEKRLVYAPGERDMLILRDEIVAEFDDGRRERSVSQLIQFGEPETETAMARAVSLPAAVATRLILEGKVEKRGVRIPIHREIYEPVLAELADLGIRLEESAETID
jgi:saccharopine dehydrogenase-like NADP-dependent oxidoreductase